MSARRWIVHTLVAVAVLGATVASAETSFEAQTITLANGVVGRSISFASANPRSYEEIIQRRPLPAVTLHAKLFLPRRKGRVPAVIIAPGSGGVSASMVVHANALNEAGLAVLLVDPFGGRGVRDTIADQDQVSFAASTYDIFAAMRALEREADIDSARIGAMGYSRGGLAVLQASVTPVATAVLGPGKALRAVLSGWPWCGAQFAEPRTAPTAVRFVVGDADAWVGPVQCQAYQGAMKAHNPAVSLRLFRNAAHGFGYNLSPQELPNAVKALNAPILYFDARGVLQDPWTGTPLPGADERTVADLLRPFLSRGTRVGSREGQMAEFMADFVGFFTTQLQR
jgi:dienelactone hydrolase